MEPIVFSEGNSKNFEDGIKREMDKPIKHYEKDLASIRTGRATTALVEDIKVECYGQLMKLREVASLATPDARLITIQPWDKSTIGEIEKAIQNSDLGINPVNDGNLIRLQLPQMSSDRRDEIAKVLSKKTEECRVNIRNIRKDFHNLLREAEKEKKVSEDFAERLSGLLQKHTDAFIKKVDDMHAKKETEIRCL